MSSAMLKVHPWIKTVMVFAISMLEKSQVYGAYKLFEACLREYLENVFYIYTLMVEENSYLLNSRITYSIKGLLYVSPNHIVSR